MKAGAMKGSEPPFCEPQAQLAFVRICIVAGALCAPESTAPSRMQHHVTLLKQRARRWWHSRSHEAWPAARDAAAMRARAVHAVSGNRAERVRTRWRALGIW
jgi:hypothetical protein